MLAVYLSIPESENLRRALNTSNAMRMVKQLGGYPNKAPLGYSNLTMLNGKKYIAPNLSIAKIIKWCFQQLAKKAFTIEEVRRMALVKGLKCSRSNFWRIIRNPVYCGFVKLSSEMDGTVLIKGVHHPIVSEELFYEVQNIVDTQKRAVGQTEELKATFPLKGYLICPSYSRKLRGSYSRGNTEFLYKSCISSGTVLSIQQSKSMEIILASILGEPGTIPSYPSPCWK